MNKNRICAAIMAVILIISALPSMIWAEQLSINELGGKLKIQGQAYVGNTITADFSEATPAGLLDEYVSYQWYRNTAGQLTDLGTQNTYTITEEDFMNTLILVITGKPEAGYSKTLTAETNVVAATAEEAAAFETVQETAADAEARNKLLQQQFGMLWDFAVTDIMSVESETIGEEFVEEYYPEEEILEESAGEYYPEEEILEESAGEYYPEEEILEESVEEYYPEEEILEESVEEFYPGEVSEETYLENNEEEAVPTTEEVLEEFIVQEETYENGELIEDAMDPQPETSVAEIQITTDDNTGIIDFGNYILNDPSNQENSPVQYVTVTNMGNVPLTFSIVSPVSFQVQDISALNPAESIRLSVKPRESLVPGEYEEIIEYVSLEGARGSYTAKITVTEYEPESAEEPEEEPTPTPEEEPTPTPGEEPTPTPEEEPTPTPEEEPTPTPEEEPAPEETLALKMSCSEYEFYSLTEGYTEEDIEEKEISLLNAGTKTIVFKEVENDKFNVSGLTDLYENDSCFLTVSPKLGLKQGSYQEVLELYTVDGEFLGDLTLFLEVGKKNSEYKGTVYPTVIAFGSEKEGYQTAPAAQEISVYNQGNEDLHLEAITSDAYVITDYTKSVIEPEDFATFTVQPKTGLQAGEYKRELVIPNKENVSLTVSVDFTVVKDAVILTGIHHPDAINGIKNGAEKTAQGLNLPSSVIVDTNYGKKREAVSWDVAGCSYNPSVSEAQSFTVNGTVTLSKGITNPNGLSLATSVVVNVNEHKPRLASENEIGISGINRNIHYTTESKITFEAIGAGLNNTNPGNGDTRYVPQSWYVKKDSVRTWSDAPYSAIFRVGVPGEYTLTVQFAHQKYENKQWVNTGEVKERTVEFKVSKATITATPTPARRMAVPTGDYTQILVFVILLGVAVIAIATVVIVIFTKKNKRR